MTPQPRLWAIHASDDSEPANYFPVFASKQAAENHATIIGLEGAKAVEVAVVSKEFVKAADALYKMIMDAVASRKKLTDKFGPLDDVVEISNAYRLARKAVAGND